MRMEHNLEQQIQARNQSGVTEEALREFSMMFSHFDKVFCNFLNWSKNNYLNVENVPIKCSLISYIYLILSY